MSTYQEDEPPLELLEADEPAVTATATEPVAPASTGVAREGLSLPHSIEAEREILAAVFVDPASMDTLLESLHADDFYLERHQHFFEAMQRLYERQGAVDLVTLQQELKDHGVLEKAGGTPALMDLLDRAGTTSGVPHYCRIVRQKAVIRKMIAAAQSIETEGFQEVPDVAEFLDRAESRVFAVLEDRDQTRLRPISEVVRTAISQVEAAYNAEGSVTGLSTGFRDFDRITQGLQGGDLVVVAARPAMGKTSFCLNLATNAAVRKEAAVAFFSLEMPAEQLALRILAAEARIDLSRLRGGFLTDDDWPRLVKAADGLSKARLYLDDTPLLTPSTIRAKCRRLARRYGLDVIIVDYLQLMSSADRKQSREQEIAQLSRSLKALAKDLMVPVVALSQLNRGLESRTDKRPLMSDLRESGAIEQDADLIAFIYREEVYNKKIEEEQRGIAELIVGKHRNGPTGTVKLKFWNAYTRFDNLAQGY